MTREEIKTIASFWGWFEDKTQLCKDFRKADLITMCDCFHELLEAAKKDAQYERNRLELLLGCKKVSKEFENIVGEII